MNQSPLTKDVNSGSLCSGDAVTLMSLAYSPSTHGLRGGLFIEQSLLSSASLPSFLSLLSLPLMGCYFWSRAAIISVASLAPQITPRRIANFSKHGSGFARPVCASPSRETVSPKSSWTPLYWTTLYWISGLRGCAGGLRIRVRVVLFLQPATRGEGRGRGRKA